MLTIGYSETPLNDFILEWEVASRVSLSVIKKKLQNEDLTKKINECAFSILTETRSLSKESYDWNRMNIFEQRANKLYQIYQNLLGLSKKFMKDKEVNEFLALNTLLKCSQASLKLQNIRAGLLEGIDSKEITSLFSVFKEAVGLMDNVLPNEKSAVYPEIRVILSEANVVSLLDMIGTNETEKAMTELSLALLELPAELRSHPAFHFRAFFQSIELLAKKMASLGEFTSEIFREEFSKFLRQYANEVLSKGVLYGSYILRKSSVPNFYIQEEGQTKIKYISIAASRKTSETLYEHTLFYYDKQKEEWILVQDPATSISELDDYDPDFRFKELNPKLNEYFFKFPIGEASPSEIEKFVSIYKPMFRFKDC